MLERPNLKPKSASKTQKPCSKRAQGTWHMPLGIVGSQFQGSAWP